MLQDAGLWCEATLAAGALPPAAQVSCAASTRCMLAVVAVIITDNHGAQGHTASTSSTLYNCRRRALCVDQVSTGAGSASSRPQLCIGYTVCLHRHQLHVVVSFVQLGLSLRMKAAACHGCIVCVLCIQLGSIWHLPLIMAAPSHAESVSLIAGMECICTRLVLRDAHPAPEGGGGTAGRSSGGTGAASWRVYMTCSLGAGGSCCHQRGGAVRAGNRTTVEGSALANGAAEMQP